MPAKVREKVKGSGRWYVIVHHEGKRRIAVALDKRQADSTAREINRRILEGTFRLVEKVNSKTFSAYSEIFLANTSVKPSTLANYKSMLDKHVNPVFGNKAIGSITRLDVKNFLRQKLKDGFTVSTVNHFSACLSNVFETALDDDEIEQNPTFMLGKIAGRGQVAHTSKVVPIFLTRVDLAKLLSTFLEHAPQHYPLALLLSRTGMRVGEAVALQWSDIDFGYGLYLVRKRA